MDGGASGSNQINMQELTAFINSNKKKAKSKKKSIGHGKAGTLEDDQYANILGNQVASEATGAQRIGPVKVPKSKNKFEKTISNQAQATACY